LITAIPGWSIYLLTLVIGITATFGGLIAYFAEENAQVIALRILSVLVVLLAGGFIIIERITRQHVQEVKDTLDEIKGYTKGTRLIKGMQAIYRQAKNMQNENETTEIRTIWCINYYREEHLEYLETNMKQLEKRKKNKENFRIRRLFNINDVARKEIMFEHLKDPLTMQMVREGRYYVGKTNHSGFEALITDNPSSVMLLHSIGQQGHVDDIAHYIDDEKGVNVWDEWFNSVDQQEYLALTKDTPDIEEVRKFLEMDSQTE